MARIREIRTLFGIDFGVVFASPSSFVRVQNIHRDKFVWTKRSDFASERKNALCFYELPAIRFRKINPVKDQVNGILKYFCKD